MGQLNVDIESLTYIKSESEFSNARLRAFLQMVMGLITGKNMHLLSFDEVVEKLRLKQSIYLGLRDIPLDQITGSTGRYEDFTRRFLPRAGNVRDKERWRTIYTLAVTGKGFPPIDVYKIDQVYFVKDGNHRVSVAGEMGWKTIQANVTELPSSISLKPDIKPDELLIKAGCAYFLEHTKLDKSCPDSKDNLDFTVPGGYNRLLRHIDLHRYLLEKEQGKPLADDEDTAIELAAADWYKNVYMPIINAVQETDISKDFPSRSKTDLYIWLIKKQKALRERYDFEKIALPVEAKQFLQLEDEDTEGKNI